MDVYGTSTSVSISSAPTGESYNQCSEYVLTVATFLLISMLSSSTGMGGALPGNLMKSFVPRVGHLTSTYSHSLFLLPCYVVVNVHVKFISDLCDFHVIRYEICTCLLFR